MLRRLTCLLVLAPGVAWGQNIEQGHQLATQWCANCHVVDSAQKQGSSTGAPPFEAVAHMKSTTEMSLHVFLQTPHGRMPDLHLTRNEIDDVTAYILSLRH